jgi:hypothetical protein
MKFLSLKGSERCTSSLLRSTGWPKFSESAAKQAGGSGAVMVPPGNRVGKLISAGLNKLVNESSPCRPPTANCRISTPFALGGGWSTKEGLTKKWMHVFPDNFSFFGDFEEAAEGRLSDQGIAIWQALSVSHARREKVPSRLVLIFSHDLVCGRIDLNHPQIQHRIIEAMNAVIEYQDIAVAQRHWRMLASNRRRA